MIAFLGVVGNVKLDETAVSLLGANQLIPYLNMIFLFTPDTVSALQALKGELTEKRYYTYLIHSLYFSIIWPRYSCNRFKYEIIAKSALFLVVIKESNFVKFRKGSCVLCVECLFVVCCLF